MADCGVPALGPTACLKNASCVRHGRAQKHRDGPYSARRPSHNLELLALADCRNTAVRQFGRGLVRGVLCTVQRVSYQPALRMFPRSPEASRRSPPSRLLNQPECGASRHRKDSLKVGRRTAGAAIERNRGEQRVTPETGRGDTRIPGTGPAGPLHAALRAPHRTPPASLRLQYRDGSSRSRGELGVCAVGARGQGRTRPEVQGWSGRTVPYCGPGRESRVTAPRVGAARLTLQESRTGRFAVPSLSIYVGRPLSMYV